MPTVKAVCSAVFRRSAADIVAVTERNTGGKESTPMMANSAMSVVST